MLRHVPQLLRALGWWVGGLIPCGVKLSEVGQYRPSPLLPTSVFPILAGPHPQFPCTPKHGAVGCCTCACLAQGYSGTSPNSFTPLGALLPQTSNTLSWALYHLSRDLGIQETLYQELKAVVPPDRFPGPEDIAKMPMLRAIIKETLRYSPALSLPRGPSHWPFLEGQGQPLLPQHRRCTSPGGW